MAQDRMAFPGSASPIEALYNNHHSWLLSWLRRRLGDAGDAADLAHDTFLKLLASSRGAALGDEPRAFLTHVAKGLVIDLWRRRELERAYLEAIAHLPQAHAPSPETQMLVVEALLQIDRLLAGLAPRTREIFLLAQLDGLTLQQIAGQMAMPVITVRRHIHKALVTCMSAL
ncbi:sigma-70 family RNA polymerase sigma factor [Comamonas endophytica]|uniref:Sigma-70 family RNA polymerase sigma factor n=1 Tax=Comamonas endophytica TaxID=2949090 RepID=A0ABY6G733_9BURK|nr:MULTISPECIES: sigma-70 family RNA polymerase sigma factor [unclassified Acidovorax]MCD2511453.1 sigma-70 family RNA polymerase sigma factor [Acidovorax sp. D4N7]UYG50844.1 sigma-70 family RNA polymerase sigma factor [Acidovorax sp. 5MLIR]